MAVARESQLTTPDGITLFIRDWLPDSSGVLANTTTGAETGAGVPGGMTVVPPASGHSDATAPAAPVQRSIVILHGLGEHCGRYRHIAAFLSSCGLSVRTYDHRGHGQSGGARGDVPDTLAMVRDAELVIRQFSLNSGTRPLLFGHSMGGLFAAQLAAILSSRLAAPAGAFPDAVPVLQLGGVILSSPSLRISLSWAETLVYKTMSSIAPHVGVPTRFNNRFQDHRDLSPEAKKQRDSLQISVLQDGQADTLLHDKISASLLKSMLNAIDYTQNHAPIITIPILILAAENDQLVDASGSHMFVEHCPSQLCTAHFYHHAEHEIFNVPTSSAVFSDLKKWLDARHLIGDVNPGVHSGTGNVSGKIADNAADSDSGMQTEPFSDANPDTYIDTHTNTRTNTFSNTSTNPDNRIDTLMLL